MSTYDDLLDLDIKLKIDQRHLQFLAIKLYKPTNKFNPSFMWKAYAEKNVSYSLRRRGSPPCSRCKQPEIWDKFIKIQRKRFVEKLTRELKRMPVSARI